MLDGWPKSMNQAKELFTTLRPMTPEEQLEMASKQQEKPADTAGWIPII